MTTTVRADRVVPGEWVRDQNGREWQVVDHELVDARKPFGDYLVVCRDRRGNTARFLATAMFTRVEV